VRQVAVADRIVLSKVDLAEPGVLLARLRRINPGAEVVAASHGVVAPDVVLRAGLFDLAGKSPDVRGWLNAEAVAAEAHHHHDVNRHDARIGAFCLTFGEPVSWPAVSGALADLV
jgi:G3E family GTPase